MTNSEKERLFNYAVLNAERFAVLVSPNYIANILYFYYSSAALLEEVQQPHLHCSYFFSVVAAASRPVVQSIGSLWSLRQLQRL